MTVSAQGDVIPFALEYTAYAYLYAFKVHKIVHVIFTTVFLFSR